MVNTKAKGSKVRLKAIKELESQGWKVGKVELTGRFVKIKDLWGLWDLCCIKKNRVLFIQTTTNRPHSHKTYKAFSEEHSDLSPYVSWQQWVWIDRKGWKRWEYKDGKIYTQLLA